MSTRHKSFVGTQMVDFGALSIKGHPEKLVVAINRSTNAICGLGLDTDANKAAERCLSNAACPKAWTAAWGMPASICLHGELVAARFGAFGKFRRAMIIHRTDMPMPAQAMLAGMQQHLTALAPAKRFRPLQLHCDAIQFAQTYNNAKRSDSSTSPEQASRELHQQFGVAPPPSKMHFSNSPVLVQRRVLRGGLIEINKCRYSDERLAVVADRDAGGALVEVLVFPTIEACVWVLNLGGRAFPIFKRSTSTEPASALLKARGVAAVKSSPPLAHADCEIDRDVDALLVPSTFSRPGDFDRKLNTTLPATPSLKVTAAKYHRAKREFDAALANLKRAISATDCY